MKVNGLDLPKGAYGRATTKQRKIDGMVLPKGSGYKIILNPNQSRSSFSWAHELGHIITQSDPSVKSKFGVDQLSHRQLEKLCDRIAAEVLMPEEQFREYMEQQGLDLATVQKLASIFNSSVLSTAIRFTDFLPFPAVLSRWSASSNQVTHSWLHTNNRCRPNRYGLPKGIRAKDVSESGPLQALKISGVVRTEEYLMCTQRSVGGERQRWMKFPTDSLAIGSRENRYVLSLSRVEETD